MKINRPNVDVKPFASQSKTEERTVFGSKEITDKLEKNLNSDFYRGWGIVPVSELPTMQDFNAVEFTISGLAAYLFQNGMAEYADKQTYYKNSLCVFEGDIYKSKTDNNAGNPVTDTTQWQSLKDAILAANIVQQLGSATDKVTSQKLVTDALNTKQAKGDYATKTELTQGLNTKLNSSNVKQTIGNSTTEVMSQKAVTDAISDNGVPVGTIIMLAHKSEPKGRYLKANGVAVSRQKYPELFEVIGTNYGAGDGSTTFNLPDLRDEFPRFAGDNREIGSKQGDAIRKITGKWNGGVKNKKHTDGSVRFIKDRIWGIDGELTSEDTNFNNGNGPTQAWDAYELDSSLEVPTADENRPRNIALIGWIKY